jgi:hypothetical protein
MEFQTLTTPAATGGTITTSGNYRIHTFTSSGTFIVNKSMNVDVLIVAGGGGGGGGSGGGGGAGGLSYNSAYAVSPRTYTIAVGSGGIGSPYQGSDGNPSAFGDLSTLGGGGGGTATAAGNNGGSGGGGGSWYQAGGSGTVGQGYAGGSGGILQVASGGGGGSGSIGGNSPGNYPGAAGSGSQYNISGSSLWYAAGGTGAGWGTSNTGSAGTANTGNGGNGGNYGPGTYYSGGNGGSGIVIVRYLSSIDVTVTSMSVLPRESPCRAGICTVDVSVTWTNNGLSTSSFIPSITASSGTVSTQSSQNLEAGGSVTLPFTVSGVTAGTCSICPNPN